jgi:hypothetical protein
MISFIEILKIVREYIIETTTVLSLQRNGIRFEKVKVPDKNYFLSDTSTNLLTFNESFF